MPKSEYAKQWKDAKSKFTKATGSKKPAEETVKVLLLAFKKGAGIEKALTNFDSAVNKGHRKDAAVAYQKAWENCGEYATFLGRTAIKLPEDDPSVAELQNLIIALNRITGALPQTLKALQQTKGQDLKVHPFLADFEGELKAYAKAMKADKTAAEAEKEYKFQKSAETCLKPLKAYTVAAGRADAAKAKQGLDDFVAACQIFERNCTKIYDFVSGITGYRPFARALDQFRSLAKTMRAGRVELERKALAAMLRDQG